MQWLVIINLTWFFANESEYFYGPSFLSEFLYCFGKNFFVALFGNEGTSLIVAKKDNSEYHIGISLE